MQWVPRLFPGGNAAEACIAVVKNGAIPQPAVYASMPWAGTPFYLGEKYTIAGLVEKSTPGC